MIYKQRAAEKLLNNAGQTLDQFNNQTVPIPKSEANSRRALAQATCGVAFALLDIADAIREHTAAVKPQTRTIRED